MVQCELTQRSHLSNDEETALWDAFFSTHAIAENREV